MGIAWLTAIIATGVAAAGDWPQWCGSDGKNMISLEKGLPESFAPGEKRSDGTMDLDRAVNVKWGVKLGYAFYGTPSVAGGKLYVGGLDGPDGIFVCFDAASGRRLWQWKAAPRKVPGHIDGFDIGYASIPRQIGVCSSAAVQGDRAYFVSQRCEVLCLDTAGQPPGPESGNPRAVLSDGVLKKMGVSPRDAPAVLETLGAFPRDARVVWKYDMWEKLGVFPCDACNGSPLIIGDLLYVITSNGVDRNTFRDPGREIHRKIPAPQAPNLIVLDKRDGRLVATDDAPIMPHILHGQWSSPSSGVVDGRKLVFFAGGDGVCYAFEALAAVPEKPVRLRTVWSYDCIPAEYKAAGGADWITSYCLGDRRCHGTLNKHDGRYVGRSEIIATPVFLNDRVYVALGRDPAHGRGRGALHCIDARGSGDITSSGKLWTYQGLDRTLSTASVAGGLVYVSDVGGRLHCLDADSGKCYWIHDTSCETWGSTLVADGKVYMPTSKGLWVLAAGKELKILHRIKLGGKVYASPVAADGTLYIATNAGWLWAVSRKGP